MRTYGQYCSVAKALDVAQSITDEHSRDEALGAIVEVQVKAGNIEEAQRVARSVKNASLRALALGSIAVAQPMRANIEEAFEAAISVKDSSPPFDLVVEAQTKAGKKSTILQLAQTIKDKDARARALPGIASALAKAGEITDALQVARSITDKDSQADALGNIAAIRAGLETSPKP